MYQHFKGEEFEKWVKTANLYGREKIPFVFVIDFDFKKPYIKKVEEIDCSEILYNFNGFTNCAVKSNEINEKIEIKQYHEDGLTAKYNDLLLRNPKGNALYHNERNKHKMIFKEKIFNNAVYYKFCRVANYSFSKMFKESYSKLFFILSLPIGIYMDLKRK